MSSAESSNSSETSVFRGKEKFQEEKRSLKRKRESAEMCPLCEKTCNFNLLIDHVYDFVKGKVDGGRTTNVYFLQHEWDAIANLIDPLPPRFCDLCKNLSHKLTGTQVSSKVSALKSSEHQNQNKDLANMYNNDPARKLKWEFIKSRTGKMSFSGGTSSRSGAKRKRRYHGDDFADAVSVVVQLEKENLITDSELTLITTMMLVEEENFVERVVVVLLSEMSHEQMASTLTCTLAKKMAT